MAAGRGGNKMAAISNVATAASAINRIGFLLMFDMTPPTVFLKKLFFRVYPRKYFTTASVRE